MRDDATSAELVDFLERPVERVNVSYGGASLDVGPYRIETLKLSR